MTDTISWNQWNHKHTDSEQIKRQNRACKKELTPLQINESDNSAVFKGSSSKYLTTLSNCNCRDFILRKLPCKHMYRLAYELHLFNLPDEVTSEKIDLDTPRLNKIAMQLITTKVMINEEKEFI